MLLLTLPAAGADYWVDPVRGDDAGVGSIERPFRTLNKALGTAVSGDTVRALPGTYGAASGEPTVLSNRAGVDLVGSGIGLSVIEDVAIDFFGNGSLSGFTFRSVIRGALVDLGYSGGDYSGNPQERTLRRSRFEGAGVVVPVRYWSTGVDLRARIEECEFVDLAGPAVDVSDYPPGIGVDQPVIRVEILNNIAVRCEGLLKHYMWSAPSGWITLARITNNTIVDSTGDAVYIDTCGQCRVSSLVIANNLIVGAGGYGVHEGPLGDPDQVGEVRNNFFSGVTLGDYLDLVAGLKATAADVNTLPNASGNEDAAPAFVGPPGEDYRLAPGSPGIDAGSPADAPPTDFAGDERPLDGDGDLVAVPDVGADEYRAGSEWLRNRMATRVDPLTPDRATIFPLRSPRDDDPRPLIPGGLVDPGVLSDPNQPLVLYQLLRPSNDLTLVKAAEVRLDYGRP